jgi:hypothetical protein
MYSRGRGGPHHLEGGAAELSHMTSVVTAEATAVVLVSKNKLLGQVTASVLQINKAGEGRIWGDLHCEGGPPRQTRCQESGPRRQPTA